MTSASVIIRPRPFYGRVADRKPPSTLDILFVLPRITREDLGHAIPDQGFDLAGAVVAAGSYIVDDTSSRVPRMLSRSGRKRSSRKDRLA